MKASWLCSGACPSSHSSQATSWAWPLGVQAGAPVGVLGPTMISLMWSALMSPAACGPDCWRQWRKAPGGPGSASARSGPTSPALVPVMPVSLGMAKQNFDSACQRRSISFIAGRTSATGGVTSSARRRAGGRQTRWRRRRTAGWWPPGKLVIGNRATRPSAARAQPETLTGQLEPLQFVQPEGDKEANAQEHHPGEAVGQQVVEEGQVLEDASGSSKVVMVPYDVQRRAHRQARRRRRRSRMPPR